MPCIGEEADVVRIADAWEQPRLPNTMLCSRCRVFVMVLVTMLAQVILRHLFGYYGICLK